MKQKSREPVLGVLQTWDMVEITDPAEIAALERRIGAAEKTIAEREKAIAACDASPGANRRKRNR